ncbi:MAG: orotidine-5'-phosphate decarboxylase [Nitrospirae bacterium YQR-1]
MTQELINKLCVALDVDTSSAAMELVSKLKNYAGYFKVGFQLFTSEGPQIVKAIIAEGGKVFLDLKFHDIPNTAAKASIEAMNSGAAIFNLHASGGFEMMSAVSNALNTESAQRNIQKPVVLAVTVLTSLNGKILNDELRVPGDVQTHVLHLSRLAKEAGLDGVVASAREIKPVREACGNGFIILTPGIRPAWSATDDQKRFMTPKEAISSGADIIVIGRPIISAKNPVDAAKKVLDEIHY